MGKPRHAQSTTRILEREDIEQIRGDVCEALKNLKQTNRRKNIFVIGGPNLILQSRPVLDKVYVTRIPGEYLNDTSIDLAQFLEGMKLHQTVNLGTCIVEEYHNETIPPRIKTHTRKRKEQD